MKVFIIEISSNVVIAEVPISFGFANTNTTEDDVFEEAWKSAAEDKIVEIKNKAKYKFKLSEN